jgi:hypothetical protein
MFVLRELTGFSIRVFVNRSLFRCFAVGAISLPLPFYTILNMNGWQGFLASLGAFLAMFGVSAWFVGLDGAER